MRIFQKIGVAMVALVIVSGCRKTADNSINYKAAINTWYSQHPQCLWNTSQKFPTQVAASDDSRNAPFAALVDQGLLVRSTSEKKVIIVSKQEINYDLSNNGRSAWTADQSQPGYGNFCYGHRTVDTITNSSPNNGQPGSMATVTYQYGFTGAPQWVQSAEVQNAFPQLKGDLAQSGSATATLTDTANGWQVTTPPPGSGYPQNATPADGRIVQ
ncbi:MAG TPA: hypothetical protein VG714_01010 [Acidobacteriaceae bacterium]|nr:hypothetical protein [Acidobacteriaceae bacterium]